MSTQNTDYARGLPVVAELIERLQQYDQAWPVALDTRVLDMPEDSDVVDLQFIYEQMDWRQNDSSGATS